MGRRGFVGGGTAALLRTAPTHYLRQAHLSPLVHLPGSPVGSGKPLRGSGSGLSPGVDYLTSSHTPQHEVPSRAARYRFLPFLRPTDPAAEGRTDFPVHPVRKVPDPLPAGRPRRQTAAACPDRSLPLFGMQCSHDCTGPKGREGG